LIVVSINHLIVVLQQLVFFLQMFYPNFFFVELSLQQVDLLSFELTAFSLAFALAS